MLFRSGTKEQVQLAEHNDPHARMSSSRSLGRSERRERLETWQQATRPLLAGLSVSLQPHPFASDNVAGIVNLMSVDADVFQLPVVELAWRAACRLTFATRDDACDPAVDQAAQGNSQSAQQRWARRRWLDVCASSHDNFLETFQIRRSAHLRFTSRPLCGFASRSPGSRRPSEPRHQSCKIRRHARRQCRRWLRSTRFKFRHDSAPQNIEDADRFLSTPRHPPFGRKPITMF